MTPVAVWLEAIGIDHVVTLDVHNLAAFQNAFRCRTDHLEAARLFASHFAVSAKQTGLSDNLSVVSPDAGGIKRARAFAHALSETMGTKPNIAFIDKSRENGSISSLHLIGDVNNRDVIIYDDVISTGSTLSHAVRIARAQGANRVYAAATHGIFCGPPLAHPPDGIVITDSVQSPSIDSEPLRSRVTVLQTADLFADAIRSIHSGDALSTLLTAAEIIALTPIANVSPTSEPFNENPKPGGKARHTEAPSSLSHRYWASASENRSNLSG